MLGTIIGLLVIGMVAGFIARALVPGKQSMSILQTLVLGIVGSFVGGFLGRLLFHHGGGFVQTTSWIGSIVGAVIVLLIYTQVMKHSTHSSSGHVHRTANIDGNYSGTGSSSGNSGVNAGISRMSADSSSVDSGLSSDAGSYSSTVADQASNAGTYTRPSGDF